MVMISDKEFLKGVIFTLQDTLTVQPLGPEVFQTGDGDQ